MDKIHVALAVAAGLSLAGCQTAADPVGPRFAASLTGAQEVPGPRRRNRRSSRDLPPTPFRDYTRPRGRSDPQL